MIMNTMENIGLQTYLQNFTVHLPFPGVSELPDVAGLNVYGILRAPRIAGTEAVVISVPYNQGNNKGALALMLSFADHCRSKLKKCSKSIIQGQIQRGVKASHIRSDCALLRPLSPKIFLSSGTYVPVQSCSDYINFNRVTKFVFL